MLSGEYPVPEFFDPAKVDQVYRVHYQERAKQALEWSRRFKIQPASGDAFKLGLLLVDVQNTFCIPGFELYVGGRSGMGAVEDNRRLCQFIYKNIARITEVTATLDTHDPFQIFHPIFFVDKYGEHPQPHTQITFQDVKDRRWAFNQELEQTLGISVEYGQAYIQHYTSELERREKFDLTIWPYHSIQTGIGHAIVSVVEEAVFFHSICRFTRLDLLYKGNHPLTEHYSVMGPEINRDPSGQVIVLEESKILRKLQELDALVIAGQAKSHCVNWTVSDLLGIIQEHEPKMASRVYLFEDCTSPVVVPDVVDYTAAADSAFEKFAESGVHIVDSSTPVSQWPGIRTS